MAINYQTYFKGDNLPEGDYTVEIADKYVGIEGDILEWCVDNFGVSTAAIWRVIRWSPYIELAFSDEANATAFKLRWV